MSLSEYLNSTPAVVGLIIEFNRPKHINGIHEDDIERMDVRRAELEAQGIKVL